MGEKRGSGDRWFGPFSKKHTKGMEVRDWQRAGEPLSDREGFFFKDARILRMFLG